MDPTLKFVIEAACLTGIILLGAAATPALGKARWDRTKWLQAAGLLVIGIGILAVNPRGWPDLFPITIGFTVFCLVITAVAVTLVQVWGRAHRDDGQVIERQAAINFSNMGVSGLLAAGCLLSALVCTVGLAQAVADAWAYGHAPLCANASSGPCRSQADGIVVSRSSTRTSDSVRVRIGGQDREIEIATGHDVWQTLISGDHVLVTSWKGHVTAVTPPGKGTMETSDAPDFNVIIGVVFVVALLLLFALMAGYGVIYGKLWRAASAGVDVDRFAA